MTESGTSAAFRAGVGVPDGVRLDWLDRGDLDRCAELERTLFSGEDPWSRAAFVSELDRGHFYLGAYGSDSRLVGYAGLAVGPMLNPDAEVHTIAVDPQHQGRGIGRALLLAMLARADERNATTFLEVRTDNAAAIGLYERHGFEIIGLRKRYYQPSGADAHTMRRYPGVERYPGVGGGTQP